MEKEQINEALGRYIERLLEKRDNIAQTLKLELNSGLFDEINSQAVTAYELLNSNIDESELLEETRKLLFGYTK